jgi:hypothetical protein
VSVLRAATPRWPTNTPGRTSSATTQLAVGMARSLLERDTAPRAEPEDLLQLDVPALIVPGSDATHATSAARCLQEGLPKAQYWDVPVAEQTAANAPARLLESLDSVTP